MEEGRGRGEGGGRREGGREGGRRERGENLEGSLSATVRREKCVREKAVAGLLARSQLGGGRFRFTLAC